MLAMRAFTGAGWLVASRFLGRLIDFGMLLIVARVLTPADFGVTALAMSLVTIVDMVLEVPVTQALVRLPAVDRSHLDTGFTLGVLRSLAITLVVMAAAWPFSVINQDPLLIPVVLALAIAPIARGLTSPGLILYIRELGFQRTFLLEMAGKIVAFCVALAVLLLGGGYWTLVVNFAVSPVVAALVSYVVAPYRPSLSLRRLSDFAGFVGWFTSAQLISALNWQFDRILLGAMGDREVLGRYAVASDLSVVATQSLIGPALQPTMAAFSRISGDDNRLRLAFLKAARFSMLISVPISLGIALTADLLVALLLGPKWQAAAGILSILALSVIATPYFQTLYSLGLAVGRPAIVFRLNLIDLAIRSLLVLIGFHLWSVSGVAAGRVAAAAIMVTFYMTQVRKLVSVGVTDQVVNLWKIGVAAAGMTIAVVALRAGLSGRQLGVIWELGLAAAAGTALYGCLLFALGMRLVIGAGRLELVDRWWSP